MASPPINAKRPLRLHALPLVAETVAVSNTLQVRHGTGAGRRPLLRTARSQSDSMAQMLAESIFGQVEATQAFVRAINRARLGFNGGHATRPLAVIAFLGPTGVGKTECVKRVAAFLHPKAKGLLKIDCSDFQSGHEVASLIGAPPGYVGREQRPALDSDSLLENENIVLFDEIEKGHDQLHNLLLQMMEDGEITLQSGKVVSFRRSIIVLTSNVGGQEIGDLLKGKRFGFSTGTTRDDQATETIRAAGLRALERRFTPEWVNRLDEIVVFRPLEREHVGSVLDRVLRESNETYLDRGFLLEIDPSLREWLIDRGYDPRYGARPLRRAFLKELEAPLADLLGGQNQDGKRIYAGLFEGAVTFFYEPDPALLPAPAPVLVAVTVPVTVPAQDGRALEPPAQANAVEPPPSPDSAPEGAPPLLAADTPIALRADERGWIEIEIKGVVYEHIVVRVRDVPVIVERLLGIRPPELFPPPDLAPPMLPIPA